MGIKETKNKVEIKEAYITKLQKFNPEDDEKGFKKLRAAYEEAMKFAESTDIEEEEDVTSIGIWIKKVKELYNNFSLRIDENEWKELLEDGVCFALDSRKEVSNKLLDFLMNHYYLPKKIWLFFDKYFSWSNRKEELIEEFPENFIEYVIDKVNPSCNETFDYYLFEKIDNNRKYDSWITLYFKIRREINDRNIKEVYKDFKDIEEFHIKHPLLEILYLRYYLILEDIEKAREEGEYLLKKYPNESFVLYGMGEVEWKDKNFLVAKEYYQKCLDINPNDYNSKVGLADCYLEMEAFKEAERIFREVLEINSYDNYVRERLFIVANKRIEELEKKCHDKPENKKIKFALGWYYFNSYRYDDVINLCSKFKPDKEDENQYFDLISRAYFAKDEYDLALDYIYKWEENLNADEEDGDDKLDQLELLYYEKGKIFTRTEEYEKALEYYNKALDIYNDDIAVINNKSYILNKLKKYEDSIKIIDKGLEINYDHASLHINKCEALFELGLYEEAMDECHIAINVYPYYSDPYLVKMKIYDLYEEYDEIIRIADELERLNIFDENTNIYKIKALTNKGRDDDAKNS